VTLRLLIAPAIGSARARARSELLQKSLTTELGEPVEMSTSTDYEDLVAQAERGNAELIWAPPAVCVQLEPMARRIFKCVRRGHSSYRSALVVRKDDEDKGLAWLKGKKAVWVDRLSLGGYLLAIAHMRKQGMDPDQTFTEQTFLGSYPDVLKAVSFGQADVTAVTVPNAMATDTLAQYAGLAHADRLGKLSVTDEAPNDALVFTGALAQDRAEKLSERLFGSDFERSSPATLCMAFESEGFVAAEPGEYSRLRPLFGLS